MERIEAITPAQTKRKRFMQTLCAFRMKKANTKREGAALLSRSRGDAAEPGVGKARVGRRLHPGAGSIAGTVNVAAKIRAAAHHFLLDARFHGVFAVGWTGWVEGGTLSVIIGTIPIRTPFPDVAGHIVESVAIGRKGADRGDAFVAVRGVIFVGKFTLPNVRLPVIGFHSFAPHEGLAIKAAAGGVFPFRFRGETFAGPFGVGGGIFPTNMDDRKFLFAFDGGSGALGLAPVRALAVFPPDHVIVERHFAGRRTENDRPGNEGLCGSAGKLFGGGRAFGNRDVAGGFDEFVELFVRDFVFIHPKAVQRDEMLRHFIGIAVGGPHVKRAAGNPDHAIGFAANGLLDRHSVAEAGFSSPAVFRNRQSKKGAKDDGANPNDRDESDGFGRQIMFGRLAAHEQTVTVALEDWRLKRLHVAIVSRFLSRTTARVRCSYEPP